MNKKSQLSDVTKFEKRKFLDFLQEKQSELVDTISKNLLSKAFENRYTLHPRRLKEIASEEVDIFFDFFSTCDVEPVTVHGKNRALDGLGERPLLSLLSIFRKSSLVILKNHNHDFLEYVMKTIDLFMESYLYGYMTERTKQTLGDQEQLRKALSTALEKQRQELHIKNHAIHTYINGIMLTDLDGKTTYINPAFMKIWGYNNYEEILKTNNLNFLGIENFNTLLKSLQESEGWQKEFKAVRPDGSAFDVDVSASLIQDEKLKPVGIMASFIDITERKRMETHLQQAQKMEAIGTLAGGIAHDFNNILAVIIGYTEILKMKLPEDSNEQADLDQVFEAGARAKGLIKQILTFSRQTEEEKKPIQVKLITKEALKLLKASLPSTINIQEDLQSESMVEGDPTQIHQVLMNLCTNAGHAMQKEGGVLKVDLVDVEVSSEFTNTHPDMKTDSYIKLTVSDTGHGIAPTVLDRIFDPFFTTKEDVGGTGMGLSVVHGIVESYGGTIKTYSEPGNGSTFNIFFPTLKRKVDAEAKEEKPIPRGIERILFVDDEKPIVNIGKQILEMLGYEVKTRTNSRDALKLFKKEPDKFDLVITDLTMPNITGDKLAKRLMATRPDIPIILCTGYSERINEEKARAMGIKALVSKPILKRDMAETVRRVLDERQC